MNGAKAPKIVTDTLNAKAGFVGKEGARNEQRVYRAAEQQYGNDDGA